MLSKKNRKLLVLPCIITILVLVASTFLTGSSIVPTAYSTIDSSAVALVQRTVVNFVNGGCVDNSGTTPPRTDCTFGSTGANAGIFNATATATDTGTMETSLIGSGVGSLTLPTNFMIVGGGLLVSSSGFYTTTATPGTIRIRLKMTDSSAVVTTIGDTGAVTLPAGITNGEWRLLAEITTRTIGATGTLIVNTHFEMTGSAAGTVGAAPIVNTTVSTLDTTRTEAVNLTALFGSASQSISGSNFLLYNPGNLGSSSASGYNQIQDEGSNLTQRTILNFTGTGITCADGGGKTSCDVPTVGGPSANQNIRSIGAGFDGGGSALTTGKTVYITAPFTCTIAAWNITVDTGTATVDVWKIATGTAIPTIANTITAAALPAISSGTAIHSTTLTAWTTAVTANDIFGFNINAVASATELSIVLQCNATT